MVTYFSWFVFILNIVKFILYNYGLLYSATETEITVCSLPTDKFEGAETIVDASALKTRKLEPGLKIHGLLLN